MIFTKDEMQAAFEAVHTVSQGAGASDDEFLVPYGIENGNEIGDEIARRIGSSEVAGAVMTGVALGAVLALRARDEA